MTTNTAVTAYAVHVEGALCDDPQISAWAESLSDATEAMHRAEESFSTDEEMPLLTIVRAEFTSEEWKQVEAAGWAMA